MNETLHRASRKILTAEGDGKLIPADHNPDFMLVHCPVNYARAKQHASFIMRILEERRREVKNPDLRPFFLQFGYWGATEQKTGLSKVHAVPCTTPKGGLLDLGSFWTCVIEALGHRCALQFLCLARKGLRDLPRAPGLQSPGSGKTAATQATPSILLSLWWHVIAKLRRLRSNRASGRHAM
jgi:hypothetical protein